jgi:hypothetical protein
MRDSASRVKAVSLIEQAATLAPNDMAIRDEKDAVLAWNADIEESFRAVEEQQMASETGVSSSVWSYLWNAVSELAS